MWPPRTLAITDSERLVESGGGVEATLVAFVAALAAAGVDAVQVRERTWADDRILRVTRAAVAAVRGTTCRVLVNERADVAVAAGAHGVHLRGAGMPASRVRGVWPSGLLIGRSIHVGDHRDVAQGADILVFGTVFRSVSKPAAAPVAGVAALSDWATRAGVVPVVAVGGIDLARCGAVRDAGACGIAGIDLFVRAYAQGPASLAAVVGEIHTVFQDQGRAE